MSSLNQNQNIGISVSICLFCYTENQKKVLTVINNEEPYKGALILPNKILKLIEHCESQSQENNILFLNLAFNYGFKYEIKQVLEKILINTSINLSNDKEINELFLLGSIPDPDFLIRTGGEKRLSNFIMYNLTYTEIFFIDTLWPDFKSEELEKIINKYNKITRRYGL